MRTAPTASQQFQPRDPAAHGAAATQQRAQTRYVLGAELCSNNLSDGHILAGFCWTHRTCCLVRMLTALKQSLSAYVKPAAELKPKTSVCKTNLFEGRDHGTGLRQPGVVLLNT